MMATTTARTAPGPPAPVDAIIDAHHHLWNLRAVNYPWLLADGQRRFFGDPAPIQRDYQVADFRRDIADLPVVGSVHIQVGARADDNLAETRWLQAQAEREGLPSAIVAFCDLAAIDAAEQLDRHLQSNRVRGVRQIVGRARVEDGGATPGLLADPAWQAGLQRLVERGLSFDLQLRPDQLAAAFEVCARLPDLSVALCHAGSPGEAGAAGFESWRRGLLRLAELPNVCCKLSGFGMFQHNWRVESIRRYVETAIEAFSPDRILFGSNFPVDRLYSDYGRIWQAYFALTSGFSDAERERMFSANARAFYRLDV